MEKYKDEINIVLYSYYSLTQDEIRTIKTSIEAFLQ